MLRKRGANKRQLQYQNGEDNWSGSNGSNRSSSSLLSKLSEQLSPRRRKLRKEQKAIQREAEDKERVQASLRAKPLGKDALERYARLDAVRKERVSSSTPTSDIDLYDRNGFRYRNTVDGDARVPYIFQHSSLEERFKSDGSMKDEKILKIWHIIGHLVVMFILYDNLITDTLMTIDDNMLPIIVLGYMIVFANIFRLIGLYAIDAIERGNEGANVFRRTVDFVRKNLVSIAIIIYVLCWVLFGSAQLIPLCFRNISMRFSAEANVKSIDWLVLQCSVLDQVKNALKYISLVSVVCLINIESVASYMHFHI